MKLLPIVSFLIVGLGLLLHVVGLATPEWSVFKLSGLRTEGLFKGCFSTGSCHEILDPPGTILAVRAMVILGFVFGALATALALIHILCSLMSKETKRVVPTLVVGLCLAAFIAIIIGIIVYAADYYDEISLHFDLGYSFALCVVGAILMLLGGGLFFYGDRKQGAADMS